MGRVREDEDVKGRMARHAGAGLARSPGPQREARDEQKGCGSSSLSLFLPSPRFLSVFASVCHAGPRGEAGPGRWPCPCRPAPPRTAALIAHPVLFKYLRLRGKRMYVF